MSPYEAFRLEIEEVIAKDDTLIFLARQVAATKHQGVEVITESASVWWLRDGRIAQIVFYLDNRAALKAAGIDPDRLASG
jgi:ketosteroid isomerase-like protein